MWKEKAGQKEKDKAWRGDMKMKEYFGINEQWIYNNQYY